MEENNYLAWPIGNYIQEGLNLGNPYGAILYAAVDLISSGKDKFTSGINNLVNVGGGGFYFVRSIKNLVEFFSFFFSFTFLLCIEF